MKTPEFIATRIRELSNARWLTLQDGTSLEKRSEIQEIPDTGEFGFDFTDEDGYRYSIVVVRRG